jgi:hypothetical protein
VHVVGACDDAEQGRRTRIALGAGWACRTGRTRGALRSSFATLAGWPRWPLCTSFSLRTLRTNRPLRAWRAGFATLTGRALRTNGALWTLYALRSAWTDRTWGAGSAGRAGWTLWPRRRLAASRCRKCDEEKSSTEALTHGQSPNIQAKTHQFSARGQGSAGYSRPQDQPPTVLIALPQRSLARVAQDEEPSV